MKRRITVLLLILSLMPVSGAAAFSEDVDYSVWDSTWTYPADVMNTKYLAPVKFLTDKKIITGDTDGLYHPEKSVTRAEYATIIARATNNLAELKAMEKEEYFSDLSGYSWAKAYINAVAQAGFFKGRSSDKFAPGESVTYAEAITVIIRFNKGAADAAEGMAPKWPDNYVAYALTHNLLGDISISDWDAPATKGNVAILLYRALV